MSQNEPQQKRRKSGPLEVVSEEQADGSFEIKFQSKEHDVPGKTDEAVSGEQEPVSSDGGGPAAYIGLIVVVVLLGAGAWLLFISPRGSEREPSRVVDEISAPEVAPSEAPEAQTPATPSRQRPLTRQRRRPDLPARQDAERPLLRRVPENIQLDGPGSMRVRSGDRPPLLDRSNIDRSNPQRIDRSEIAPSDAPAERPSRRIRRTTDRPERRTRARTPTPTPTPEPVVEPAPEVDDIEVAPTDEPLDDEVAETVWDEPGEVEEQEEEENLDDESEWDDDEFDEEGEEAFEDDEYIDDEYIDDEYIDDELDDEFEDDEFDEEGEEAFEDDEYY